MPVIPTKTTHKTPYPAISPRHPKVSQAGRTVLVTGGATGIGLAISRAFIAASASRLIIIGRRGNVIDATIDKLAEEVKELGDNATMLFGKSCDVTDPKSSESFWDSLAADGIVVDTMVLNAASPGGPGPILERGTEKVWEDFTANVRSTVYFTERFYGQGGHGVSNKKHLVNISTGVIHDWDGPGRNIPSYALTKNSAALFLQQVARHVDVKDMQIVSFNPGSILTETVRKAGYDETSGIPWDNGMHPSLTVYAAADSLYFTENLPGHFAVWAASSEAEMLHGRFVWASWDVDELLSGEMIKKLKTDANYLRIGVVGLD